MFLSAAEHRASREAPIRNLYSEYIASKDTWNDGSLDSLENRTAQCARVLRLARSTLQSSMDFANEVQLLEAEYKELVNSKKGLFVADYETPTVNIESRLHREAMSRLPQVAKKWVTLESHKFIEANKEFWSDRDSLLHRASEYVHQNTARLPMRESRVLVAAFQAEVAKKIPRLKVQKSASQSIDYSKLDDRVLFLHGH